MAALPGGGRERLFGIALQAVAVLLFAALDAAAKYVNQSTDPLLTASVRYLGSFALVSAFLNPWTQPRVLRTRRLPLQVGRALCLVLATVCSFYAYRSLPLAQATAISFAAPLITALAAGKLLGERLDRGRLLGIGAGFVGVLVITRPGSGSLNAAVLLAFLTAFSMSLYSIATRQLSRRDSSQTTMVYTGLVGCVVFLPVVPFVWHVPERPLIWLLMAATALFGAVGHWLLILAHHRAPASVLAPFNYLQLLWASLFGVLVFGDLPDRWTLAGGLVVIASGLYLLGRERRRGAAAAAD